MQPTTPTFTFKRYSPFLQLLPSSCAVAELSGLPTDNQPEAEAYGIPSTDIPRVVREMVLHAEETLTTDLYMGGHPGLIITITSPYQEEATYELIRNGFHVAARFDNPVYTRAETGQSTSKQPHPCYLLVKGLEFQPSWGVKSINSLLSQSQLSLQETS